MPPAQLGGLIVLKDGKTFAEVHFSGDDENWGQKISNREFDADSLHDLRSVTKSVTGLQYGIALSEGIVPGTQESLVAQFPEYRDLNER